ncbi:hypothetical protein PBV87_07855 [Niameybacter massiliensis]|uniref:Uncharacterized protein n=1 Tax=Holtiella tumoricola TaxID=3018743 RepID=A0AA42J0H8_9FIRM|nr:hypothetical protein [Holtiella tumoricola]MDA3731389.1 hypothetical protein [Holtiella tumoricola]
MARDFTKYTEDNYFFEFEKSSQEEFVNKLLNKLRTIEVLLNNNSHTIV